MGQHFEKQTPEINLPSNPSVGVSYSGKVFTLDSYWTRVFFEFGFVKPKIARNGSIRIRLIEITKVLDFLTLMTIQILTSMAMATYDSNTNKNTYMYIYKYKYKYNYIYGYKYKYKYR